MPILLVILLTATCLPVEWWPSPFGLGVEASAGLTAGVVAALLLVAFGLRTWVLWTLRRQPDRRVRVGQIYDAVRRLLFFANLGAIGFAIFGLGWGSTVQQTLTLGPPELPRLAPFAELAVPLPYFLVVFGCWLIYFDAERALHRAHSGTGREFWSRAGYFFHNLRQLALLVVLPVGLVVTQQSVSRLWPKTAQSDEYRLLSVAAVLMLVLFMPLVIRPLLGLRPLPAGPVRDRLTALARRLNFRYTDLLVWPTRGVVANAMIVGLLPRVRYVIFTDRILEEMPPEELDGVFGHEVGHAKHGHIWFYAAFLALSMTVLAAVVGVVGQWLDAAAVLHPDAWYARLTKEDATWMALPFGAVVAAYVFLVFGYLSRRCERQADVFGCRVVSCSDPRCTGHTEATVYPANGAALCPTGIRTFARALERVGLLNGHGGPDVDGSRRSLAGLVRAAFGWLRAWQHSTMPRRIAFLLSLIDNPARERRFQRRVKLLRWGLAIGLAAALVLLGETLGWHELLKAM